MDSLNAGALHHVQDIGKLLHKVQDDLANLRSNLSSIDPKDQPQAVERALSAVIAQAEADLRDKADTVLHSVLNNSVTTLPDINDKYATQREPSEASSKHSLASSSGKFHLQTVHNILDPEVAKRCRRELDSIYGVSKPKDADEAHRERRKPKLPGKRIRKKTSEPGLIVPAKYRNDPGAVMPVSEGDAQKGGIFELVNRGFLGHDADLTAALPLAMMSTGAANMHDWHEQHIKSTTYVSPIGFDVSSLKLDVPSKSEEIKPPTKKSENREPYEVISTVTVGVDEADKEVDSIVSPTQPHVEPEPVEAARTYAEIMDEFSLHQFIIRKGKTLETPEFQSFTRAHQSRWGRISELVRSLEAVMTQYSVPIAYVDGKTIALLAEDELLNPSLDDLLSCLVNENQVRSLVQVPGRRFVSANADDTAAVVIQSCYRMFKQRNSFSFLLSASRACRIIQRRFRVWQASLKLRRKVAAMRTERLAQWRASQELFKSSWSSIQQQRRVVVHIPSFSADEMQRESLPGMPQWQNTQLARLLDVLDANVDVLMVIAAPLSDEVRDYYTKLLSVAGVANASQRFRFIVPENYDRLRRTHSLATVLLYSPRALKRIQTFVGDRPAYIVPNLVGADDVRVSMKLQIPLLGPEDRISATFSSKSGCKRLFAAAQVNMPPAAYDIYSEEDCFLALTRLVIRYPLVRRWLFKLDDEFGGRGHVCFDMATLNCQNRIEAFNARYPNAAELIDKDEEVAEAAEDLRLTVKKELAMKVPKKAVLACSSVYKTWREYVEAFARSGGVIEACPSSVKASPSANVFIAPDGEMQLVSTQEQLFGIPFVCSATLCPMTSLPAGAVRAASLAIGKVCYSKGIIGNVGIDFVVFVDEATKSLRLWAVDLNIRMTSSLCGYRLFSFLTKGGNFNPKTGTFHTGSITDGSEGDSVDKKNERAYCHIDMLANPKLSEVQHTAFFNLCRLRGVSYDLKLMVGTAFKLIDSFVCGAVGMISIQPTREKALSTMCEALDFIRRDVGIYPASMSKDTDWGYCEYNFVETFKAVREASDTMKTKKEKKKPKETEL